MWNNVARLSWVYHLASVICWKQLGLCFTVYGTQNKSRKKLSCRQFNKAANGMKVKEYVVWRVSKIKFVTSTMKFWKQRNASRPFQIFAITRNYMYDALMVQSFNNGSVAQWDENLSWALGNKYKLTASIVTARQTKLHKQRDRSIFILCSDVPGRRSLLTHSKWGQSIMPNKTLRFFDKRD